MAGKVSGVTHPANLANGATITETWVDNVTNSIIGLDGALAKVEPIHIATNVSVTNDNTENTLFTYTVPANTLGTGNIIWFDAMLYRNNNTGVASETLTIGFYYGSSSVFDAFDMEPVGDYNYPIRVNGGIVATGATNTQTAWIWTLGRLRTSVTYRHGEVDTTFAEDSTTALDFKLTGNVETASANLTYGLIYAAVYLVDVS